MNKAEKSQFVQSFNQERFLAHFQPLVGNDLSALPEFTAPFSAKYLIKEAFNVTTPAGMHTRTKVRLSHGPSVCVLSSESGTVLGVIDGKLVDFGYYYANA